MGSDSDWISIAVLQPVKSPAAIRLRREHQYSRLAWGGKDALQTATYAPQMREGQGIMWRVEGWPWHECGPRFGGLGSVDEHAVAYRDVQPLGCGDAGGDVEGRLCQLRPVPSRDAQSQVEAGVRIRSAGRAGTVIAPREGERGRHCSSSNSHTAPLESEKMVKWSIGEDRAGRVSPARKEARQVIGFPQNNTMMQSPSLNSRATLRAMDRVTAMLPSLTPAEKQIQPCTPTNIGVKRTKVTLVVYDPEPRRSSCQGSCDAEAAKTV
ncbi:hypothetical protein DFH08DRAFT_820201 [Mycena albidolilacea]|uniref:Uncharacterized protein n=1 Tax=Mycena albidolilacea TaxID=1033008 RepID=A0AAD6ZCU2_9AGAR|nr:hypothetical protein DFH08DRAFT_820201 [Mycena albidolilacea]